jgi:Uncharacterized protein conserved in bacteria
MNNCRRSFGASRSLPLHRGSRARSSFIRREVSLRRAAERAALRYGIGVGREGFQWQGLLRITRKQEWPDWTPPPEMIERQPYLPRFMAGGPGNPMGARALYLGTTVYRSTAPISRRPSAARFRPDASGWSIGDVIDLYDRIPVGTKVIVRQKPEL